MKPTFSFEKLSYSIPYGEKELNLKCEEVFLSPGLKTFVKFGKLDFDFSDEFNFLYADSDVLSFEYDYLNRSILIPKNNISILSKNDRKEVGVIRSSDSSLKIREESENYFLSVFIDSKIFIKTRYNNPVSFFSDIDLFYKKTPIAFDLSIKKLRIGEARFTTELSGNFNFYEKSGVDANMTMWISDIDQIFDDIVNYFIKLSSLYQKNDNLLPKKKIYIMYSGIVKKLIESLKQNERKNDMSTKKSLLIDIKTDKNKKVTMNGIYPDTILSLIINDYNLN